MFRPIEPITKPFAIVFRLLAYVKNNHSPALPYFYKYYGPSQATVCHLNVHCPLNGTFLPPRTILFLRACEAKEFPNLATFARESDIPYRRPLVRYKERQSRTTRPVAHRRLRYFVNDNISTLWVVNMHL